MATQRFKPKKPDPMVEAVNQQLLSIKPTETAPTEIIADSIAEIAEGVRKLRAGRLNEAAIVLLIHYASKVSQRDIRYVLNAMESLERTYLKKAGK